MKIKKIFQDKHKKKTEFDWVLIQKIERDICYIYHQLSRYNYIMGDLYYEEIFNIPYWEYVNNKFPEKHENFIHEGILIILLAMGWEIIDSSGYYLYDKLGKCIKILEDSKFNEKEINRLKNITVQTLKYALLNDKNKSAEQEENLFKYSRWAHEHFIKKYFCEKTSEFNNNSYFDNQ